MTVIGSVITCRGKPENASEFDSYRGIEQKSGNCLGEISSRKNCLLLNSCLGQQLCLVAYY